jgi:AhpD family alkylhydroperoxidase
MLCVASKQRQVTPLAMVQSLFYYFQSQPTTKETLTMARIPYADLTNPEAKPLVERIVAERGGVLHLYQMLLHSPPVASGWLNYLTAIRQQSTLPGGLRELVIMRIAVLNGAPYEAEQHAPIALREGVSQVQLDDLDNWQQSKSYDATQRAVLAYTDAMTKDIHVSPEVFAAVKAVMTDRLLVELTATVGAYNMVSRFLEALQIHSHDQR